MADTKTEIANMALYHCGNGTDIGNIDTENSNEAKACRRFIDVALAEILRQFRFPFSTAFLTLSLVQQNPTQEWGFSYRYPADCLFFRRILSGNRTDSRQSRVPYKFGQDQQGMLVYCDLDNAQCEYTQKQTNVTIIPPDVCTAWSLRLAAYIAVKITAGDPWKLKDRVMELYRASMAAAAAAAMNEEQPDQPTESEFIRSRNDSEMFPGIGVIPNAQGGGSTGDGT